jgi:hypothetical protein
MNRGSPATVPVVPDPAPQVSRGRAEGRPGHAAAPRPATKEVESMDRAISGEEDKVVLGPFSKDHHPCYHSRTT